MAACLCFFVLTAGTFNDVVFDFNMGVQRHSEPCKHLVKFKKNPLCKKTGNQRKHAKMGVMCFLWQLHFVQAEVFSLIFLEVIQLKEHYSSSEDGKPD